MIAKKFSRCDFLVFWNVGQLNKEACVGALEFSDSLTEAPKFIAKTCFVFWTKCWVLYYVFVLHLPPWGRMENCIHHWYIFPMVVSQWYGVVGAAHVPEVSL
jgi:hypothetical protein